MVRGIEQELEGHLEYLGDLEFVQPQFERRGHEADHRGHAIAGHRDVLGKIPEDLHLRGRQADFLCGLPQRGFRGIRVPGLGAAARKADLSGVVVEVRGTAREQDREPVFTLDHRHQHGGGPDFSIPSPKVAVSLSHRLDRSGLGKSRAQPEFVMRGDG